MGFSLRNRSFLKLLDFDPPEIHYLLDLARDLKSAKYGGTERQGLQRKNIALIFEKTSTRTRCAFEVAAADQGAHTSYLDPTGSQMDHKESMRDTARVLGRMYDAIGYRGFSQAVVEGLAEHSGVPVYNGLTDEYHPTQVLADLMTMREFSDKPLGNISFCYTGDARCNMGHSLAIGGCLMGMDVRIAAPKSLWPDDAVMAEARRLESAYGARLTVTEDPVEAVAGCDFVHTDVWVSMGEEKQVWEQRIELLKPYQVNRALMAASGNDRVRFMHCLPAFHNRETRVGEEIYEKFGMAELEVTDEVFESPAAIQFAQAENRLHSIKAILVGTLGN